VDSFYPYVVLNFMLHGVPLIYAGQEYGIQKKPELFERDVMDLSCVNIEIFAFYKRLIHMRKDSDVLRSRNFNNPALKRPQGILMIEKNNGTEKGMAILNYTHTSATIDIPMEYPKGLNIKSGHQIEHSGSIDIEPWGVNYLYQ
jgi:glycosidase